MAPHTLLVAGAMDPAEPLSDPDVGNSPASSDIPKTRTERIERINELERDGLLAPGQILIRGIPWMCVQTHAFPSGQPVYINITYSDKIPDYEVLDWESGSAQLPIMFGPPEEHQLDESGSLVLVFDGVVGAKTPQLPRRMIQAMIPEFILGPINAERVRSGVGEQLSPDVRVIKKWSYFNNLPEDQIIPIVVNTGDLPAPRGEEPQSSEPYIKFTCLYEDPAYVGQTMRIRLTAYLPDAECVSAVSVDATHKTVYVSTKLGTELQATMPDYIAIDSATGLSLFDPETRILNINYSVL